MSTSILDDTSEAVTVVEKYVPIGREGLRRYSFAEVHGRTVAIAIVLVTVGFFVMLVWLAKSGADTFRKMLGDPTESPSTGVIDLEQRTRLDDDGRL